MNKKYGVTGSWTQGLVHAKHALYQLSYNPVVAFTLFTGKYNLSLGSEFGHGLFHLPIH